MRACILALSALALCGCETTPEFLRARPGAPAATSSPTATPPPTPAPPPPRAEVPPEQQLLEAERRLSAAAQQSGLGPALASMLVSEESMVIRPGAVYSTPQAVTQGLPRTASAGPIYWQPDRIEVSRGGDVGITSGRYVQVVTGAEAVQGRYVIVWRREQGEWRILTEMRTPDPPRAAARRRR